MDDVVGNSKMCGAGTKPEAKELVLVPYPCLAPVMIQVSRDISIM